MIVDAALAYKTAAEGLKLIPAYRDIGIYFLEAPLPLDNVEGHAEIAKHIPIGVGDLGLTHADEFADYMDRWGASICQPDITMVGGFTGILKVLDEATKRNKQVITHGYKTNIEIAANLHFLAFQPREEILEWSTSKSPIRWNTTREKLPVESDGKVAVPQKPGLGVTLDWDFVEKHRVVSR
jgi:L-alanine-DL-glutamate epimerase-like enolase superfamily enzyme